MGGAGTECVCVWGGQDGVGSSAQYENKQLTPGLVFMLMQTDGADRVFISFVDHTRSLQ